jgi:Asp/Glu/hydantoin racemase
MTSRILVINPNSNESVTRGIDKALDTCRSEDNIDISCVTLTDGPVAIETDEDIRMVVPLVVNEIWGNDNADAFVIASYSDPGLEESRAKTEKPVFGIQESAIALSATFGRRFGVLALGREPIQRHIAYVRQMGCQEFHAGERPLDISIDKTVNEYRNRTATDRRRRRGNPDSRLRRAGASSKSSTIGTRSSDHRPGRGRGKDGCGDIAKLRNTFAMQQKSTRERVLFRSGPGYRLKRSTAPP